METSTFSIDMFPFAWKHAIHCLKVGWCSWKQKTFNCMKATSLSSSTCSFKIQENTLIHHTTVNDHLHPSLFICNMTQFCLFIPLGALTESLRQSIINELYRIHQFLSIPWSTFKIDFTIKIYKYLKTGYCVENIQLKRK